ncbi:putative Rmd1/YagE family protein [Winogradskyella wandonensis]|uniref:Putative Rmd1/YagE family protein n=1 Tax=Winogradskyella wandonensis TaxID=1442586 RepID=A0A4R1KR23_9FLAO|nr:RMD1 family protein [Winogradskyella wandonensis]TCK66913.1 putative Rmd1/YagE family protein [Winogradskyella wandonensis]
MNTKAIALLEAESFDIKGIKSRVTDKLLFFDRDELFYQVKKDKYYYVLQYGVVCYFNLDNDEVNKIKSQILNTDSSYKLQETEIFETVEVATNQPKFTTSFDTISITDDAPEKIRLIMLNLSQSVILDAYAKTTETLLEDTRKHTSFLEANGKLDISGKKLKRYIGKVLNIKNKISENLYIFDSPEAAWEDEVLNNLNNSLKKVFDLKERYTIINQQLSIIKENLDLFKDIMFHKESSKLEWIIIILIVIEVIDLFILKFTDILT